MDASKVKKEKEASRKIPAMQRGCGQANFSFI
jgi:hypothetical protein